MINSKDTRIIKSLVMSALPLESIPIKVNKLKLFVSNLLQLFGFEEPWILINTREEVAKVFDGIIKEMEAGGI